MRSLALPKYRIGETPRRSSARRPLAERLGCADKLLEEMAVDLAKAVSCEMGSEGLEGRGRG
jgi:hypothetical protein